MQPAPIELSNDDAERFLAAFGDGVMLTFQTFDDTKAKRPKLTKVFHGPLEQHVLRLRQLNAEGAGIFFMVNRGDGRGRRTENVVGVRALFVDLDGAPLEPVLDAVCPPHIIVESSPQRWHAYWLVEDVPLEQFAYLQTQLAVVFGGDLSVKDLPRVMRVPGFAHNKHGPAASRLVSIRHHKPISAEALKKAFGIPDPIITGARNTTLFRNAMGFKSAGIPMQRALDRVRKLNTVACDVPLDDADVRTAVSQAYGYAASGFSMIGHSVIDSDNFQQLSPTAVKVFMLAMRRHRPSRTFSLPHGDFVHLPGLKKRQTFRAAVQELLHANMLVLVRNYVASVQLASRECALYRISDWVVEAAQSPEKPPGNYSSKKPGFRKRPQPR